MGERVEIPERIAIWVRFRPRHCTDALSPATRLRPRPRFPCPILVQLAATCFPKNAHPRPHSRPQRLLGEPSPEHVSRISPRKKRPPRTRRALLTSIKKPTAEPCRLQPQRLLQCAYAPAAYGDFLFHAVQREQQRAAGDRLDFLDHGKVYQIPAMHTEEPVTVQTLL